MESISINEKIIEDPSFKFHRRKDSYSCREKSEELNSTNNSLNNYIINKDCKNTEEEIIKSVFQYDNITNCEQDNNELNDDIYFIKNIQKKDESKVKQSNSHLFTEYEPEEKTNNVSGHKIGKKKRSEKRQQRFRYQDNIRIKNKRSFLRLLVKAINKKLKMARFKKFFPKFLQSFAQDVKKERNKQIINLTIFQILEKKGCFKNVEENLKLIKEIKAKKISDINDIFNRKYRDLYKEYLYSKEFNIDEIKRLRNAKHKKTIIDENYIVNYKDLAKNFIEFIEQD